MKSLFNQATPNAELAYSTETLDANKGATLTTKYKDGVYKVVLCLGIADRVISSKVRSKYDATKLQNTYRDYFNRINSKNK